MLTTITVQRFTSLGLVLVASIAMAPRDTRSPRSVAKDLLHDAYCTQDGFAPLRVLVDGMVISYVGVRDSAHLDALYAALRPTK